MTTTNDIGFIRVMLEQSSTGLYIATSPDLSGVCVTHRDLQAILDDFPSIVKLWFKSNRKLDVEVFSGPIPTKKDVVWQSIVVPAEVAARELQR